MFRLAEDRWTNSDRMSGALGVIARNRDTRVPQANDIGSHVALENGLEKRTQCPNVARNLPWPSTTKTGAYLATLARACALTLARRSVQACAYVKIWI
jgi:hypothetical protein